MGSIVIDPDEDNFTENITAEKTIFTGAGGRQNQGEIKQVRFRAGASDIGYYEYNFSATDSGGLSDWQNLVVVKIKCEYYDNAARSGDKWTAAGKTFDYNPACCEVGDPTGEYSRLRFKDGETVGGCTCNAQGTCGAVVPPVYTCTETDGQTCEDGASCPVGQEETSAGTCESGQTCCKPIEITGTCTANARRCEALSPSYALYICNKEGTVEDRVECSTYGEVFCSNGKCCHTDEICTRDAGGYKTCKPIKICT